MKTIIPLIMLFCIFSSAISSQKAYTLTDTTYANQLLKESREMLGRRQFDSAMVKTDSALLLFEPLLGTESDKVVSTLYLKSFLHHNLIKKEEAVAITEKIIAIQIKRFGEESLQVAQGCERLANIYVDFNVHKQAIPLYEKVISIKLKLSNKENLSLAQTYFQYGRTLTNQIEPEKALIYLFKALPIFKKELGEDHRSVAWNYVTIANNYAYLCNFELSQKYFELAKKLYLEKHKSQRFEVSKMFQGLSNLYFIMGEYDKVIDNSLQALLIAEIDDILSKVLAIMHLSSAHKEKGDPDKAIDIIKKFLETLPDHNYRHKYQEMSWLYATIADSYLLKEDYDNAIDNYTKAIGLISNNYPESYIKDNRWLAYHYQSLSHTYNKKKLNLQAIDAHKNYSAIMNRLYDSSSIFLGNVYGDLAIIYEDMQLYDSAWHYRNKELNCYTDKMPAYVSIAYQSFAQIAEKKKDFLTAQSHFDKALSILHYKAPYNLKEIYNLDVLISILDTKATFERRWYLASGDIQHIKASAETYKQAFTALNYRNSLFHTEGAKADQKKKKYSLYEGAIETLLLLKTQHGSKDAFSLNEQSKAALLQSQLKETNALRFANIPDSLLEQEKKLRFSITAIEKKQQELMSEGRSEIDSINLNLAVRADSLKSLYVQLKKQFEKNYPNYYRLKYDFKTVDIGEVQQNLLSKSQTLLSYFVGDSSIYAFVVRPDTLAVFNLKKDFPLELWIKRLRNGIYGYHIAGVKTEKLYETQADSFAIAAFELYQKLISPLSNMLTKELVIVPDGVLGYIPFDVLLIEKPKDALKFVQHRYFGKNHIISYNYSATLWQEMQNKKHKTEPTKNFIGFAPYYNGDTALLSSLFSHDLVMRKGLDSLKYSGEEVFKAQKLMHGEAILNKKATKEAFEAVVGDYRVVHLATHGKANDKIGDYCFLAFTEQKDNPQTQLLYVRDIYNLTLNADLVVLSACETGIGELKRGEGIVSLARAFAYAGAKGIVTTLWSVNDKSTMHIMEIFYRYLRKGYPKDYALWQAKMDYLQKSKSEMAHPFFWSAFVPVGDMQMIKK